MNYRDMLLMDYFDEDYDIFDESQQEDYARDWVNSKRKNHISPGEFEVDYTQGSNFNDWKATSKNAKRIAMYLGKSPESLTQADLSKARKINQDFEREYNQMINSKAYKNLAADKLQARNNQKQREANNAAAGVSWEKLSGNKKVQAEYERQLQSIARSNGWHKGQNMEDFITANDRNTAKKNTMASDAYKNAANTSRQNHKEDEKLRKAMDRIGANSAANGEEPTPEKASKFARAKGYLKDHKAGAGAVGAGVGAAAGAAIAGKGIHDLATLKNPAKAKAAWKASGSNLPFDEWLKKEKRKAGIKTAIGGAAAAAGAAGAAYLGHKQVHQESLGELLNEFDDILMEEAYLEGYYGQLIAESNGYSNEFEMIMSESYDEYDYEDYYDEDYLGLPYFG